MDDYISRKAARDLMYQRQEPLDEYMLDSVPPADVRPVVYGHWVWDGDGMDWGIGAWRCDNCGARPETTWNAVPNINPLHWSGSKYCCNCGAEMKEANDE